MAKDKKKDKGKKADKQGTAKGTFKALADNPMVADVVAAALVATASALKDSNRARALASDAGDELAKLSKAGAERGSVLWDMALQIGKRSLEAFAADPPKKAKSKTAAKSSTAASKSAPKGKAAKKKATKASSR